MKYKKLNSYYKKFTFLDDTGNPYIIGSDDLYVFYFDKKISSNLFGIKKIFLISNDPVIPATVEPEQDKILLADTSKLNISNTDSLVLGENISLVYKVDSFGFKLDKKYNGLPAYLHCLYFVAHSEEETNNIYQISFNLYNEYEFKIAAEFECIDESLKVNLQNMGMRLTDDISSALNTTNPHEVFPDTVLLNNKYKELLSEYMNIIGNMGSYDSLINSLKWFGYDENNIKIYEFWKNATSKKYDLSDIENRLYSELASLIKYYQKTTYIGIFYYLNNIKTENGRYIYETDISEMEAPEPVPVLEDVIWNYTAFDLYLKMSLLSQYYQKYFMPIHIDLFDLVSNKAVFSTIKNINTGLTTSVNRFDNLNLTSVRFVDSPSTYFISECTAWINQSNKWNTFKDYEVKYVGPIYALAEQNGGKFEIFNENTLELKNPNVFIASDDKEEIQYIDKNSDAGLNGFYIITDGGVKIPLSFEYKENNMYSKFELYIYYSSEYNVRWPKDWSNTPEGFARYYFEKKIVDNPYRPVDETLHIFTNREGHYLFQCVFTDYYGAQTVINKEVDVKASKIDFKVYKLVPSEVYSSDTIRLFEGINYVSKKILTEKSPGLNEENYIGDAFNKPIPGSYTFDFLNKDYSDVSRYSSKLFFFTGTKDEKENKDILLTNHIIFIKLNEIYGTKTYLDDNSYIIKYDDNTQFYGSDLELSINGTTCGSLPAVRNAFDDYIWTLKEGDDTFGKTDGWNTVLVGISSKFGEGGISEKSLEDDLTGKFEWISQQRFILDMYTLEELNNSQKISPYTLIYLKADVDDTYFAVDENGNPLSKWLIENESITYNKITKKYQKHILKEKLRNNYLFSPFNDIYHYNAEPGYYSITFRCKYTDGGENVSITKKNFLCVEK